MICPAKMIDSIVVASSYNDSNSSRTSSLVLNFVLLCFGCNYFMSKYIFSSTGILAWKYQHLNIICNPKQEKKDKSFHVDFKIFVTQILFFIFVSFFNRAVEVSIYTNADTLIWSQKNFNSFNFVDLIEHFCELEIAIIFKGLPSLKKKCN